MAGALIAHVKRHNTTSFTEARPLREFADFLDPKEWLGNFDIEMLMLDG